MHHQLTGDPLIRVARDQVCCDLDGETVILSLKTGKYHGLNAVGARIWDLIQEPKTFQELLQVVSSEFNVESVRCERDVRLLLNDMTKAGLVDIGA